MTQALIHSFNFVHICLTFSLNINFTKVARLGTKIIAIIRSKKSKQQTQKITVFKNTILEFLRLSLNLSFIRRWKQQPLKYLRAIVAFETNWMKFYLPNVKMTSAATKSDTMKPSWKIPHYCWIYYEKKIPTYFDVKLYQKNENYSKNFIMFGWYVSYRNSRNLKNTKFELMN